MATNALSIIFFPPCVLFLVIAIIMSSGQLIFSSVMSDLPLIPSSIF